jgi:glutaminyl-tRNA synthetase
LFEAMKNGDYPEGSHVLRAKIDMSSANMLMRDPLMYRVLHVIIIERKRLEDLSYV